ncbi:MAG: LamG domain-containing protein [Candidatus Altiarchaeota archaeon]|nr:LamG domain-containing protein [Candidatus Altiarchaeota archaeon]MBU4436907.1 LamG domain-containing protein [Candidatus Altiarchaeota archaeon]
MPKKKNKLIGEIEKFLTKNKVVVVTIILIGLVASIITITDLFSSQSSDNKIDIQDSSQVAIIQDSSNAEINLIDVDNNNTAKILSKQDDLLRVCSQAINQSCILPRDLPINEECLNNITVAEGMFGNGLLIDGCDILFFEAKDVPTTTGTVELWVKFNEEVSGKTRFLFDGFEDYNKNRVSLYLQPDNLVTFSIFEGTYSSFQIREKLDSSEVSDWLYFVITWDEADGLLKLHINGNLRKSRDVSYIEFTDNFKYWLIGSNLEGKFQANAVVDEVRTSSIVRPASYVYQVYQNAIGTPGYGNLGPEEILH